MESPRVYLGFEVDIYDFERSCIYTSALIFSDTRLRQVNMRAPWGRRRCREPGCGDVEHS